MTLLLAEEQIRQVLSAKDAIEVVTAAHAAMARGEVVMPVRLTLRYDERPSELEAMPACIRSMPALGMKVISYVGTNTQRGLPAISALVILLDSDHGTPLAVMEGGYLTAARTAAASAMATRALGRPDAETLAIVGAGAQGRMHLQAMLAVHPFRKVSIWNRTAGRADKLARETQKAHPNVAVSVPGSIRAAVEGADVIVTATSSPTPVLQWEWIRPGAHINAIGSHSPDSREMPTEVVVNARRFVDSRGAMLRECGDILIPIAEGAPAREAVGTEIGEVVAGLRPGRVSAGEVTLYKSGGIALQDVATAHFVYARAKVAGLGTEFHFRKG